MYQARATNCRTLRAALLVSCLAAMLASSCIRHVRTPLAKDLRPADSSRARFAAWSGPELPGPTPQVEPLSSTSPRHDRFALRMPSVTHNNQAGQMVTATYYAATAPGPRPLVVVLPIWGSSAYPPRKVVNALTGKAKGRDASVLWIHGDARLIDWPSAAMVDNEQGLAAVVDRWVESIAGTVVDIRRLIAWSHTRPEVARNQVAVVGFSIGSIVGALVTGTEERVSGGVLVAGGANLHQILVTCRGNTLRFRQLVEERLGWSPAQLEAWLEPRLESINPVNYTSQVDPRSVLIIDADRDKCIPQTAREDLWISLGRPERLSLGYGHRMSFLSMTFLGFHFTSREIVDFLDRTLLEKPGRNEVGPTRRDGVRALTAGPGGRYERPPD